MADYIVKDTELTSVANAIRTAGGTSSLLTFPNGFINAVNNISGGGGSSDFSTAEVTLINHSNNYSVDLEVVCVLSEEELVRSCSFGDPDTEYVIEAVFYKNTASYANIQTGSGIRAETTGDVRIISLAGGGYSFEITGDGTITIS